MDRAAPAGYSALTRTTTGTEPCSSDHPQRPPCVDGTRALELLRDEPAEDGLDVGPEDVSCLGLHAFRLYRVGEGLLGSDQFLGPDLASCVAWSSRHSAPPAWKWRSACALFLGLVGRCHGLIHFLRETLSLTLLGPVVRRRRPDRERAEGREGPDEARRACHALASASFHGLLLGLGLCFDPGLDFCLGLRLCLRLGLRLGFGLRLCLGFVLASSFASCLAWFSPLPRPRPWP